MTPGVEPYFEAELAFLAEYREAFQRRYIDEALARNGGNRTRTARQLEVDPRTIFRHLERKGRSGEPG